MNPPACSPGISMLTLTLSLSCALASNTGPRARAVSSAFFPPKHSDRVHLDSPIVRT